MQYVAKESETLRMVGIVRNDVIIECISGTLVELLNEENGFETLTRSSNNKNELSCVIKSYNILSVDNKYLLSCIIMM
jgi:hypothetical protein